MIAGLLNTDQASRIAGISNRQFRRWAIALGLNPWEIKSRKFKRHYWKMDQIERIRNMAATQDLRKMAP